MARSYNTKSKGLLPLDGAELNPAYGPWNSVAECTNFWTEINGLVSVPEGANCAVKAADGSITKYVFKKGEWKKDYQAPEGGIPKDDLASAVQASLTKADSALQSHQSLANYPTKSEADGKYQPKGNYLTSHQDISHLATKAELSSVDSKATSALNGITSAEASATASAQSAQSADTSASQANAHASTAREKAVQAEAKLAIIQEQIENMTTTEGGIIPENVVANVASNKAKIFEINAEIEGTEEEIEIPVAPSNINAYYKTQGISVGSTFNPNTAAMDECNSFKLEVKQGEKYIVTGYGTANLGLYVLTDNSHIVKKCQLSGIRVTVTVTVDEDGFLYVNNYKPQPEEGVKKRMLVDGIKPRLEHLESKPEVHIVDNLTDGGSTDALSAEQGKILGEEVFGKTTKTIYEPVEDGCFVTSGCAVGVRFSPTINTSVGDCKAMSFDVTKGDTFVIKGLGNTSAIALYVLCDSNNICLVKHLEDARENPTLVSVEQDGKMYVNFYRYEESHNTTKVRTEGGYKEYVNNKLKEFIPSNKAFEGKTIVCFGDSITGFIGNGKRYSDHLADLSGANVINVGNGGTRLSQRGLPTDNPTDVQTCYAALDIVSLVESAFVTHDFTKADVCAQYADSQSYSNPSNKAVDAVNRLKEIDWNKVDAITILAGTNDYTGGTQLGEESSEDVSTLYGAINTIVRYILTAYPKMKIYFFTFPVRWFASSVSGRTEENWCDNRSNFVAFKNAIVNGASRNHVMVGDLYSSIGWTKYNFSTYFVDSDSTHPYNGFGEMGKYIYSFMRANLLF